MKSNVLKRLERIARIRDQKKVKKYRPDFPNLKCREEPHALSNTIDKGGFNRDKLYSHRWRKGAEEKPETVKEIQAKTKRIRPLYGKGAGQYATDGDNTGPIRIYQKGA